MRDDSRYLQLTAAVQPGNSGGPLLDLSGNVVGLVSARINALAVIGVTGTVPENINFAIKSTIVREFLEANHIIYDTAQSTDKLDPADIGGLASFHGTRVGEITDIDTRDFIEVDGIWVMQIRKKYPLKGPAAQDQGIDAYGAAAQCGSGRGVYRVRAITWLWAAVPRN